MATTTGANLGLGVIFTGRVSASFKRAVAQLRSSIIGLNNIQQKYAASQATSAKNAPLAVSNYAKVLGGATSEATKYQKALVSLGKTHTTGTRRYAAAVKTLNQVESALARTANGMTNAGRNGEKFFNQASRISAVSGVMSGRLRTTASGIQRVATKAKGAVASTKAMGAATAVTATKFQGFSKQISKVHGGMERVKAAFKVTASYGLASAAIYSIVTALKSGVNEIIQFDQAMKNLEAISGATRAQLDAMKSTIEEIANVTKFSTTEIAQGMVLLAQAGFSAEEAIGAMQATANLATGTLSTMATTADLMTTAIRAFGLEAIEAGRVSDVMANAINKSKLTIDKLRIAFNFVGAAAAQTGLSIEETASAMMVLANHGLRASTIGTGLRQALARLLAPNRKLREAFKEHGIALDEVNPRLVGFQQAFKNLAPLLLDHKRGMIDMGKAYQLFGLRGAQAAAILSKAFLEGSFDEMYEKVNKVGTAEKMMGIQAEGLAVKIKNLADKAKLLALAFGDAGAAGAIGLFIDLLRGGFGITTKFAKTIGGSLVISIGLYTAAVWGAVAATKALMVALAGSLYLRLHNLVTVFYILTRTMGQFKAALVILGTVIKAHPILFFAAVIGAAAGAVSFLNKAFERNIKAIQKNIVESNRSIGSLKVYIGALKNLHERLEKGEKVGGEYNALVKRLIKDHPELAKMVDVTTASYKELTAAMEEMNRLKTSILLEDEAKEILAYRKELDSLNPIVERFNKLRKETQDYNRPMFADELARHKMLTDLLAVSEQSYLLTLVNIIAAGSMSLEQAKKQINSNFLEAASAEAMYLRLTKSLDTYEKRKKIAISPPKESDDLSKREQSALNRVRAFDAEMQGEMKKNEAARKAALSKAETGKERFIIEEEYERKANKIRRDGAKELEEITARNLASRGKEIESIEKKIEILEKEEAEIESRDYDYPLDQTTALAKVNADIIEQERTLQDAIYKIRLASVKKYSKEYNAIIESMYRSDYLTYQEYQDYLTDRAQYEADLARDLYDRKLVSAEAYYAKLEVLNQRGELTDLELSDAKIELLGSAFTRLTHGLTLAGTKAKSFADTMQDVGEALPVEMTNQLTDGFFDAADGIKSTKEAFEDFAKNTLRWLAELIVKQQIYNMLVGVSSGGGLLGGIIGGIGKALGFAGGGWIREPVVGLGMNSGRAYTIAEDEAEYVSPGGKMGKAAAPSIQILIENKSGTKIKQKNSNLNFDGKKWVLSTVLEALSSNSGYKNNFNSALTR